MEELPLKYSEKMTGSSFQNLPVELLLSILDLLEDTNVVSTSRVNKQLRRICTDEKLWQARTKSKYQELIQFRSATGWNSFTFYFKVKLRAYYVILCPDGPRYYDIAFGSIAFCMLDYYNCNKTDATKKHYFKCYLMFRDRILYLEDKRFILAQTHPKPKSYADIVQCPKLLIHEKATHIMIGDESMIITFNKDIFKHNRSASQYIMFPNNKEKTLKLY